MGFGSGPSLGAVLLGEGTPGHVVERARAAERGGLDSLWFIEDYFQTGAFAVAGAAAAVTTRLGIGLGVVNPYTRHPAGERVSHEGAAFSLRDVALEFKPAQATLPIVLGVKGPRALALAGAVADGVVCSIMSSPAHVRRVFETASAARRRAG